MACRIKGDDEEQKRPSDEAVFTVAGKYVVAQGTDYPAEPSIYQSNYVFDRDAPNEVISSIVWRCAQESIRHGENFVFTTYGGALTGKTYSSLGGTRYDPGIFGTVVRGVSKLCNDSRLFSPTYSGESVELNEEAEEEFYFPRGSPRRSSGPTYAARLAVFELTQAGVTDLLRKTLTSEAGTEPKELFSGTEVLTTQLPDDPEAALGLLRQAVKRRRRFKEHNGRKTCDSRSHVIALLDLYTCSEPPAVEAPKIWSRIALCDLAGRQEVSNPSVMPEAHVHRHCMYIRVCLAGGG